ncbi:MAG: hypothetical protein KIS72_03420 [Luteimonas sp.]|nr:hypothetical protein [Luteimonas sp.]
MSADPALVDALLAELAAEPAGMSLPRLCKRLGVRMSVLMRTLAWIGEDSIGGIAGAALVRILHEGQRDIARLTEAGRVRASARPAPRST